MIQRCCLALLATVLLLGSAVAGELVDDFSNPKMENRRALRGEWQFQDNVASCVADPELYKKFNNHGPILRWPVEMTDGTVQFEFRAVDVQRMVITFNETGHVLRASLNEPGRSSIFGWIGQSSKENKPKVIAKDGVPSMNDLNGKLWAVFRMTIQGDTADVRIGNYTATLKHPSIAREKGEFTISFASGKLMVRDMKITY